MQEFIFIHIGKCGGGTVDKTLRKHNFKFKRKHVEGAPVGYNPKKNYLILLRNPVERFVSAFYWRKWLVFLTKQKRGRIPGEYEFFQKYPTIESLIQDDISILKKQYVGHIKQDINHFIGNFVDKCSADNITGVICTEKLNEDIERIFNVKTEIHKHDNRKSKIEITEKSRECIKEFVYKDYLVIEKLNKLKLLSKEQYEILSR